MAADVREVEIQEDEVGAVLARQFEGEAPLHGGEDGGAVALPLEDARGGGKGGDGGAVALPLEDALEEVKGGEVVLDVHHDAPVTRGRIVRGECSSHQVLL